MVLTPSLLCRPSCSPSYVSVCHQWQQVSHSRCHCHQIIQATHLLLDAFYNCSARLASSVSDGRVYNRETQTLYSPSFNYCSQPCSCTLCLSDAAECCHVETDNNNVRCCCDMRCWVTWVLTLRPRMTLDMASVTMVAGDRSQPPEWKQCPDTSTHCLRLS